MAHRRTREEKVQAKHVYAAEVPEDKKIKFNLESTKSTDVSASSPYHELVMPTTSLKADLTKTLIVTILALILQFSLASYLQNGGWNTLQKFIEQIF